MAKQGVVEGEGEEVGGNEGEEIGDSTNNAPAAPCGISRISFFVFYCRPAPIACIHHGYALL